MTLSAIACRAQVTHQIMDRIRHVLLGYPATERFQWMITENVRVPVTRLWSLTPSCSGHQIVAQPTKDDGCVPGVASSLRDPHVSTTTEDSFDLWRTGLQTFV